MLCCVTGTIRAEPDEVCIDGEVHLPLEDPLAKAIEGDEFGKVQELLSGGGAREELGFYLFSAQSRAMAEKLIEAGADPFLVDPLDGMNLLIWAARTNNPELLKFWLEIGHCVNFMQNDGHTALFNGLLSLDEDGLRLLFEHGADPNTPGYSMPPLSSLVFSLTPDTWRIELLLEHGADPLRVDWQGNTVKALAMRVFEPPEYYLPAHDSELLADMRMRSRRILAVLERHGLDRVLSESEFERLRQLDPAGLHESLPNDALSRALADDDAATVSRMLAEGEHPDDLDPYLFHAISAETAALLVDRGADPGVRECDQGTTPLMWAALRNDLQLMSFYLQRDVPINARDFMGRNAFYYGALTLEKKAFHLFVEAGAIIDEFNAERKTPLMKVISEGGEDDVWRAELLLELGARLGTHPRVGLAPRSERPRPVFELLEERADHPSDVTSAIELALRRNLPDFCTDPSGSE